MDHGVVVQRDGLKGTAARPINLNHVTMRSSDRRAPTCVLEHIVLEGDAGVVHAGSQTLLPMLAVGVSDPVVLRDGRATIPKRNLRALVEAVPWIRSANKADGITAPNSAVDTGGQRHHVSDYTGNEDAGACNRGSACNIAYRQIVDDAGGAGDRYLVAAGGPRSCCCVDRYRVSIDDIIAEGNARRPGAFVIEDTTKVRPDQELIVGNSRVTDRSGEYEIAAVYREIPVVECHIITCDADVEG